jgi:4-hydroxy-tetrahydrodipicolinate reductase
MKAIIVGPKGKMGKFITQILADRDGVELIGGITAPKRDYIGEDLGQVANLGRHLGVPVSDNLDKLIDDCDIVIDFSTKEMALKVLNTCIAHKKALVCGTTGFSETELQSFKNAGDLIPVLYAANTSKVVNVMNKLLEYVCEKLGDEADIEILEMHDAFKKDAPSGTSKEMGEIMATTRGQNFSDVAIYGRHGVSPREKGTIGYHSLRSGNISSNHIVYFGFMGERLEIAHHSYSFECFARGACDCAEYLAKQPAGYYTVKDVLDL